MNTYYITRTEFIKFLKAVLESKAELYAPFRVLDSIRLEKVNDIADLGGIVFDGIRPDQPAKSFFYYTREKVATLPKSNIKSVDFKKRILLGLSGCDLHALKVFDKAYYEEGIIPEPFYKDRREATCIISSDCGYSIETCFCTLLGAKPYPAEGFDLNLSSVGDGFVMEVGSKKGEELIDEMNKAGIVLSESSAVQLEERKKKRDALTKKIETDNKEFKVSKNFDELCKTGMDSEAWKNLADKKCVQCNGCLNICPTCYCFLLYDRQKGDVSERMRVWDACISTGYARVAGGANPRASLQSRLRHRFLHKFLYFLQNFDMYACSGCGRCAQVCPGKIEIRETFRDIQKEKIPNSK